MSTNKKIRKIYDDTFKSITETMANHENLRQLTNQLKNPTQTINLPITLADVSIDLFSVCTVTRTAANKPSKRKATKSPEVKCEPAKKKRKK